MNYENQKFCQCCGMPMGDTNELYGTEANGSKSSDYCSYCYEGGKFKFEGTMDEMIEICIAPVVESNPKFSEQQARDMMKQFFPSLKRWKSN